jgi:hypothetical protein
MANFAEVTPQSHGPTEAAMIYPGEGKEGEPKAGDYVLAAERVRAEAEECAHPP